jgi:methionyl-tRNA formyltransferase
LGVPPSGGNSIRIAGPPESGTPNAPRPILLKIWKVEIVEMSSGAACRAEALERRPGEILSGDKNGIVVACGKNALRILELQREGGKRLTAEQFLAGCQLKPGEKF